MAAGKPLTGPGTMNPGSRRTDLALSLEEYGRSVEGARLLWLPPRSEHCELLLLGGIHGEEPDTTVLLSRALRSLEPRDLHPGVGVILCANPDGLALGTRGNARGVDLNRNFSASNWQDSPSTCRWHVGDRQELPIGTGSRPSSEPEVAALERLLKARRPMKTISLHGPLDCIDDPSESALGIWLSKRTGSPLVTGIGYPTPGSMGSWMAEMNLPLITWEFPNAGMEVLSRRFVSLISGCLAHSLEVMHCLSGNLEGESD